MNYAKLWDAEHSARLMRAPPLARTVGFFERFIKDDMPSYRVLEPGCGTGSNLLWLAEHGFSANGFDASPHAISRLLWDATAKKGHVPRVMVHDMTKRWFYPTASFDVVFEVRAFENLTIGEVGKAYVEMERVLKPGGWFYCMTASPVRDHKLTTCGRVRTISDVELRGVLTTIGFTEIAIEKATEPDALNDWCATAKKG